MSPRPWAGKLETQATGDQSSGSQDPLSVAQQALPLMECQLQASHPACTGAQQLVLNEERNAGELLPASPEDKERELGEGGSLL